MIAYSICLSLTYFTQSNNILICPHHWKWQDFIPFNKWVIFHCIYISHIFISQPSVNGHLGCFHVLNILNSEAMNIEVPVSFGISIFIYSRYIPRNGIAGAYSHSIFNLLRHLYTVSYSVCTNLHFHQQCVNVPFLHIFANICCW